jgi:hypothetical protein
MRLIVTHQRHPSGAVRFVADDEVKRGHSLTLRASHDVDRLVGAEDDSELVVLGALGDLTRQRCGVRRGRIDEVVDRYVLGCVRLAHLHVRTHGIRPEGDLALLLP